MGESEKSYSGKNTFWAIVFWLLAIAVVLVIFDFSTESGQDSAHTSNMIVRFFDSFFNININEENIIRKIAHIVEFAILTIFSYLAIYNTNKISRSKSYSESPIKIMKSDNEMCIIFTSYFTILNAIFDEYHQLYVSGRSGTIIDVFIDMIGIVVVLLIARLVFTVSLKVRGRKEVRYS